jgi:ATP-dependent Clp protease ATP-binding subunit ClpX
VRPSGAERPGELLDQLTPEDLIEFGMIPEFVGRLPVTATLDPLTIDDLVRILTEPKNAIVRQYQKYFELERARLEFSREALRAVADVALKRETGVRALRSILEGVLLDAQFDLPTSGAGKHYVVEADHIAKKSRLEPSDPPVKLHEVKPGEGKSAEKTPGPVPLDDPADRPRTERESA